MTLTSSEVRGLLQWIPLAFFILIHIGIHILYNAHSLLSLLLLLCCLGFCVPSYNCKNSNIEIYRTLQPDDRGFYNLLLLLIIIVKYGPFLLSTIFCSLITYTRHHSINIIICDVRTCISTAFSRVIRKSPGVMTRPPPPSSALTPLSAPSPLQPGRTGYSWWN